jgi:hypothetical protein
MGLVVITRKKIGQTLRDVQVWLIAVLSAVPVLGYHIYGLFIVGELESQLKGRFFPQMWDSPDFYLQWKNALSSVSGHYLILIIGLVGLLIIPRTRSRLFLLGTWLGYLLFGFGFSYHISTHYYYTLPVIPLLAVSLGGVSEWVFGWFKKTNLIILVWIGTVLVIIAGMAGGYYMLNKDDYRHEPGYYQKVANFVNPEDKIVALSQDYGYRLSYFGWRYVIPWKGTEDLRYIELRDSEVDPFSKRFSQFITNYDYFIITRMKEFRRQSKLYDELYDYYQITKEGGGYVIFDLRERFE